ncbi:MAG: PRC-barrel domain-containing protein [Actinomycetota bacterium]|nr:PRC-barrel domain-containing protein [Actinomycetota bacterium]
MVELDNIRDWRGQEVVDPDGEKIGKLEDVYFDIESDEPHFARVKTGLFGRRLTFVPLMDAVAGRDRLEVAYAKDRVKDAPTIDPDGELSDQEEADVYRFYGMDYSPSSTGGRRLARR